MEAGKQEMELGYTWTFKQFEVNFKARNDK